MTESYRKYIDVKTENHLHVSSYRELTKWDLKKSFNFDVFLKTQQKFNKYQVHKNTLFKTVLNFVFVECVNLLSVLIPLL